MNNLKYLLGPMRVPFLILAPACVVLGLGTAVWSSGSVSPVHFVVALVGAVCAHISVNAFNEYFDFKSGLDFKTQRTPFSGGSGTLPANPGLARQALTTAVVSVVVVCLVGLYFLAVRGLSLLPLGIAGILVVILYTPWLAHNPLACLVAPGLGFGTLMVVGTHLALTGDYSRSAFIASFVPFFLVSNLLLLNQFPDVDADRSVGRKNYPIVIGRRASSLIYGAFSLLAFLSIVLGVLIGYLPRACLLGLFALVIAVPAAVGAYRYADDVKRLAPYMGLNVVVNIATPVLVAVGLFVG
jgi:1,4-dihydroxy-2-naphthoate octaprenyltransferase